MWEKLMMNDEEEVGRFHAPNGLLYTGVGFCAIMESTHLS